jgi:poly-gamma-glutamate synthesis protein (capsule biosynthesis protein)
MASWNHPRDVADVLAALTATPGDLRLLSVHYGQEMQLRPSPGDERRLREAVERHGVDLVVGHHAHVAAGVQEINGRLIFYGLGNLLHPGMQDMARHGVCRDYGLLARIHYGRVGDASYRPLAIEAFTLEAMHVAPRVRTGADGRARIVVLNHLAEGFDGPEGTRGVRFMPQADGRGLYCAPGAQDVDGPIGAMCRAAETARGEEGQAPIRCKVDVVARRGAPSGSPRFAAIRPSTAPRSGHAHMNTFAAFVADQPAR